MTEYKKEMKFCPIIKDTCRVDCRFYFVHPYDNNGKEDNEHACQLLMIPLYLSNLTDLGNLNMI